MTPSGITEPMSGLCRLPLPLPLDADRSDRIAAAVNVPAPKGGVEAIGEWKRFSLARREGHAGSLAATPLGRELGFLLAWMAAAPFGAHVSAASLLVSALDSAARPHAGPPEQWRLLVPLDDYPHVLHICGEALFWIPSGTALAIAPRAVSSAGCFGHPEAMYLVIDIVAQEPGAAPGLPCRERPRTLERRRFGPAQLAAVMGLDSLLNHASFERVFDLLCMLPFDFEIDAAAPLAFAAELAGRTGRSSLVDRAEALNHALLGAPNLAWAA